MSHGAVEQRDVRVGNPDALLFVAERVVAGGIGVADRRYCAALAGIGCNVSQPVAVTRSGPDRHTHPDNNAGRDRSGDR